MDKNIIISIKTIALTALALVGVYVLYTLGPILGILIVATLLVIALEHYVQILVSKKIFGKKIGRGVAVVIVYLVLILTIVFAITIALPPIISEGPKLLTTLGLEDIPSVSSINENLSKITPDGAGSVLNTTRSVFSNLAAALSSLVIALYMSLDWVNLKRKLFGYFPQNIAKEIQNTLNEIETSIGHWVKGQLILMILIGSVTTVGMWLLGVRYPLTLGLVAGLLEIVPILGPIAVAIVAAIIAFADSTIKGIAVIAFFTIVQQLEGNFLVPKIMQKVSGFSPLSILIALLVGYQFFNITGAILAVPGMMVFVIVLKRILDHSFD